MNNINNNSTNLSKTPVFNTTFTTFIEVMKLLTSEGATNINIALPRIDKTTGKRYRHFEAWYYGKSGNPYVLLIPALKWEFMSPYEQESIIKSIKAHQ